MLHLQKASAGSGKTYTLTRTYIKFLIGIKSTDGKYRLRTRHEIIGSHSHILAVTFTNKATDEMKRRIVDKLADLASDKPEEEIDFMQDFMRDFGESRENIRQISGLALSELLNNYTDFQVSTIDSFFQSILRTFAYESDLRENYQIEIDDEYITGIGVNTTLSSLRESGNKNAVRHWAAKIMNRNLREGKRWNILQRDGSAKSAILKFAEEVNKERFKQIRFELESYFKENPDFEQQSEVISREFRRIAEEKADTVRSKAIEIQKFLSRNALDGYIVRYFNSQLEKTLGLRLPDTDSIKFNTKYDGSGKSFLLNAKGKKAAEEAGLTGAIVEMAENFYRSIEDLLEFNILAKGFETNIPLIGLLREVMSNISQLREDHNIIQLNDTNSMLKKIINEDDAPFIYERTGYFINHYLIDEFQDTSRMQWENFNPLLNESLSRGNDNLIIGDAKQSIYRFRDADYSLITSTVPENYDHIPHGDNRQENTNWRSARHIVEFNNSLFASLIPCLSDEYGISKLPEIYSNTIQYPQKQHLSGYVEIRFESNENLNEEFAPDSPIKDDFAWVTRKICDLIRRGYRQKDIAVLVSTRHKGNKIIDALVNYNRYRDPQDPPIEFMSEETLRIARARSVNIITAMLRRAIESPSEKKSIQGLRTETDPLAFSCEYNLYSAEHPEASPEEIFEMYFQDIPHTVSINEMLAEMQTTALPAMVENIVAHFIPRDLRISEAPYIAAFQDKVLDYCESYTADPASFLQWWDTTGQSASVSTPPGTDAVNIMTIHKSKGLEFKCVIIPDFSNSLVPTGDNDKLETVWVRPYPPFSTYLPPYMPLQLRSDIESTPYKEYYTKLREDTAIDCINTLYVGLTRAIENLFISIPPVSRGKNGLCLFNILPSVISGMPEFSSAFEDQEKKEWLIKAPGFRINEAKTSFIYGEETENTEVQESLESASTGFILRDYFVNPDLSVLKYKESEHPVYDEDEDPDPRSEGNIRHYAMSRVTTSPYMEDEIKSALSHLANIGTIAEERISEIYTELMSAISKPEVEQWFSPDLKVYNERELLLRGHKTLRPDRFTVSPERDATVIDYKFGAVEKESYRSQVRDYIRALKATGLYRSVTGFIWYVSLDKIIPVKA